MACTLRIRFACPGLPRQIGPPVAPGPGPGPIKLPMSNNRVVEIVPIECGVTACVRATVVPRKKTPGDARVKNPPFYEPRSFRCHIAIKKAPDWLRR